MLEVLECLDSECLVSLFLFVVIIMREMLPKLLHLRTPIASPIVAWLPVIIS